jgi:hypothetical protein
MASFFSSAWQFSQREQLFFFYGSNSTPQRNHLAFDNHFLSQSIHPSINQTGNEGKVLSTINVPDEEKSFNN